MLSRSAAASPVRFQLNQCSAPRHKRTVLLCLKLFDAAIRNFPIFRRSVSVYVEIVENACFALSDSDIQR